MGFWNTGYGFGRCYEPAPIIQPRQNNSFTLLVVLFVLLIIVGSNYPIAQEECPTE